MSANPRPQYTLAKYLELDRKSEERLEYWNGKIYSMSGVSEKHIQLEINLMPFLHRPLSGKSYRVFPGNIRIKVPSMPPYRYADISALYGKAQFEEIGGVDALTNPMLIVEVLSPSTEGYDRGDKFTHYKSIPSFIEYLLVAQHRPHISQFIRQGDGSWLQREFNDLSDVVRLFSLDCELPLSEVYQNVSFDSSASSIQPVAPQMNE
jgi:Uma2 family endonuclease